jgi:hypothetical protein
VRANVKPKSSNIKEPVRMAMQSLQHGGRAGVKELSEIAEMSVVELLSGGLTLEQAEAVLRMAAIEVARLSEEARMLPRTPAVEVKFKNKNKGNK